MYGRFFVDKVKNMLVGAALTTAATAVSAPLLFATYLREQSYEKQQSSAGFTKVETGSSPGFTMVGGVPMQNHRVKNYEWVKAEQGSDGQETVTRKRYNPWSRG